MLRCADVSSSTRWSLTKVWGLVTPIRPQPAGYPVGSSYVSEGSCKRMIYYPVGPCFTELIVDSNTSNSYVTRPLVDVVYEHPPLSPCSRGEEWKISTAW